MTAPDELTDAYEAAYTAGRRDGYNDGRTDRWADLLAIFRALKLDVAGDGASIVIDTSALAGAHGVRRLIVERAAPESDEWRHYPSGVAGPLAEVLIGIAWSYARFPEGAVQS